MTADPQTRSSDAQSSHPAPEAVASMGGRVGSAAIWMFTATVLGKGAAFAAQIALGLALNQEDFALYAYAAAATKLLSICQDAGIRDLLIQDGAKNYPRLSGPIFWFAACFNIAIALIVAASTPLVALYYGEPRLQHMMWVLLLSIPLGTPAAVLSAKLRLDLQFKQTSLISSFSAVTRQIGQVCFAFAGAGAMSFIYPAVLAAVIDSFLAWWVCRDQPWTRSASIQMWPELLRRTKYLILGSVANLFLDQGPYLVLQPALRLLGGLPKVDADTIQGNVFWAFQMSAQVGVLLSFNMQLVLSPVFQRLSADAVRLRSSVLRALGALMLLGSFACIALGVLMDPLEKMIFQGKWAEATDAVAIYGLFFPFRILYGLTTAAQISTGRTSAYFWTTVVEGLVFTLSAVVAGVFVTTPSGAAWWTGAALALVMMLTTLWVVKGMGISRRRAIVDMCWPWLLSVVAGAAALLVDNSLPLKLIAQREWTVVDDVPTVAVTLARVGGLAGDFADLLLRQGLSPKAAARVIEAARFILIGAVCSAMFTVMSRLFLPDVLRDTLRIAPGRIGHWGRRLLFFKPQD